MADKPPITPIIRGPTSEGRPSVSRGRISIAPGGRDVGSADGLKSGDRSVGPSRGMVSRSGLSAAGSDNSAMDESGLKRQEQALSAKNKELLAHKNKLEQVGREAQRRRDEALRNKEKEKELKRIEEERAKEEAEAKRKALQERREENVRLKMLMRERTAQHQRKIIAEYTDAAAYLNAKRDRNVRKQEEALLERHSMGEFANANAVSRKMLKLRRVFVLLDCNGDGLIDEADMKGRMKSFGVEFQDDEISSMFEDVRQQYGEISNGGGKDSAFWRWGFVMDQPNSMEASMVLSPGWSHQASGINSDAESDLGKPRAWNLKNKQEEAETDVMRLYKVPPTRGHLDLLHNHTIESRHRIVCPDSTDNCTKGFEQQPPVLSPRKPFDLAPQSVTDPMISPVVLTEAGMMTEIDFKTHLAKSKGLLKSGFTWTEFRDCFITFSCHEAHDIPLQFLSIVEFLMTDERGAGTTNLEDAMELLFRRFGVPTDNMFVKLFGNDCDPKMQMPLGHYLEKVALLIQERRELSLAAEEHNQQKQRGASGSGVRKRIPNTPARLAL